MNVINALKDRSKQKRVTRLHSNSDKQDKKPGVKVFRLSKIADQFGDEWHKNTVAHFVRHMIDALFGDGWHRE